jgi:PHD/YefM family antitoxin component YafN of YafNO toxin-antitoxin module
MSNIVKSGLMTMLTVTESEFRQHFDRYQDEALTRPVVITRKGRELLVMLSAGEYWRLKRRDREVLRTGDLSDEELEQIAKGKMDPRHDHLDAGL